MLQDHSLSTSRLTVPPPSPLQTDVVEETLSFDPATGEFTFGSSTQPITGEFHIALATPQRIIINAGPGIELMPDPPGPFGLLPLNTSGALGLISFSPARIELDASELPSTRGVLAFLLFVRSTMGSIPVQEIETPPFFVIRDQAFTEPEFDLQYFPATGDFQLSESGGSEIPPLISIEKGTLLLRLGDGSAINNEAVRNIKVSLTSEGVVFADPPAVFTLASGPGGPTVTAISSTEILITRDFTPGTGFGASFGVEVLTGTGQTCTVFSPDPIIIDKQIGTGG